MHLSLLRRSRRISLPLQCLLWIFFGLLAVVPWQHIRGEDATVTSTPKDDLSEWGDDPVDPEAPPTTNSQERLMSVGISDSSSLIFRGQSPPPGYNMAPIEGQQPSAMDQFTGRSGKAFGAQVRLSGITGPAIGREHPIFPFELMPYAFLDNNVFFTDIRGFTDTKYGFGGNFGGGYRHYFPGIDRIFGVNAYYDYDNTSGALFREVGFGVETLGALFDMRANAYFPTGSTRELQSIVNLNGTQVFSGHNLLVDQQKTVLNALRGFDAEVGFPIPGAMPERHDLRFFGGGYWFEGDKVSAFGGWKGRFQANVIPNVAINLQVSNDSMFKTNVVFGATWSFGGYRQPEDVKKTQFDRMTTPVQRQYNMVVGQTKELEQGVAVINPATNLPYFFEHVDSNAAGPGDGTVENPFKVFTDAQNPSPHDIIFVHAGSTFSGISVALEDNVRVLGESPNIDHLVVTNVASNVTNQGNSLLLPHLTTAGPTDLRPMFLNSPGVGVSLANNSEFSGFQIGNAAVPGSGPAGIGIFGNNISNVVVRQTDVSFSGGEGVLLNNTGGSIFFLGDTINTPTGNANTFHVNNTQGNITVAADTFSTLTNSSGSDIPTPMVINNTNGLGGRALLIENTAAGSNVNFTTSTVNSTDDNSGSAILVQNVAGIVSLGDANIDNNNGFGVNIINNSGIINGNGTYTINGSISDAINIQNLSATGRVNFNDPGTSSTTPAGIKITNRQARGINLFNNAGNVNFNTPVSIASAGSVALAAIDYQNNTGNVIFNNPGNNSNSIDITNGGIGILIGDVGGVNVNTGSFTVNGPTHIVNPAGVGIRIINDRSSVTFNGGPTVTADAMIDQRQDIGIQVLTNHGVVIFNGISTIANDNATPTNMPAVDIRGNSDLAGSVTFNGLIVNDALGPAAPGFGGIGVNLGGSGVDANPANITFNTLQINNATGGTAFFANNVGQISPSGTSTGLTIFGSQAINPLAVQLSTISAVDGEAMNIQNSVLNVRMNQVSSQDSPTNGITLVNNQSFPLTTTISTGTTLTPLNNYMFQILGINGTTLRNGGTIQGAANAGISITQSGSLFQTGAVNLVQSNLVSNDQGAVVNGLLQLTANNINVSTSTHNGMVVTNVPQVDISQSNFNLNGTDRADNAIHLVATQSLLLTNPTFGNYRWNIVNNNTTSAGTVAGFIGGTGAGDLVVVDSNNQVIQIQTSPTTTLVTPLIFNFTNNSMQVQPGDSAAAQSSALAVNWTGIQSGNINGNTINLTGFDRAISIVNNDPTQYTAINTNYFILGNTINATGGGNVGLFVNNFGPTALTVAALLNSDGTSTFNNFNFTSPTNLFSNTGDTAMNFSVLNSTNNQTTSINLTDNIVTMVGQNSEQGVVFQTLQGPANVILSNNNISVDTAPNAPTLGQGINFQSVLGTINLSGNLNNTVTINGFNTVPNTGGVTTADWVRLSGNRTGSFFVNGFTYQ